MVVEEVGIPTTEATIPAVTLTVSATTTTDAGRLASVLFGDAHQEEETIDFPDRLASTAAVSAETAAGAELAEVLPTSTPAVRALDEPSPPDPDARPVQIRIPAIKVKRSIVELPEIRDPATGAWTQDLDVLFRKGRKDLVGHYMRSAVPGQAGNMILAGHNYGYGTRGVFLKLGRLKEGEEIHIVNAAGEAYTYRVMAVEKVPWRSKDTSELLHHSRLLAPSGEERLTLVTCGGSKIQPFPARIYVIAEPVGN
jgi:LPXTG-site transpeptidase (sortase) family protein